MKPNKAFLIIFSVILTFGLLLGGVYFYISKTLTPETVRQLIVDKLQDSFPKAKVEVGTVDFRFGTSIDFVITEIEVKTDHPLFAFENARVKIPIWAILKGGGIVELDVAGPKMNWTSTTSGSNWSAAMEGVEGKSVETKNPPKSEVQSSENSKPEVLPAFLLASRLNVKLRETKITYNLSKKDRGEILISKLLVKELGLDNPAAFEIDTQFQMQNEVDKNIMAHILMIGEVDFKKLLSEEKIGLVVVATVSKVGGTALGAIAIPDMRSEVKAEISKKGDVTGNAKLSFKNSTFVSNFEVNSKHSKLGPLNGTFFLQDFIEIYGEQIPNLNAAKSQLTLSGDIKILKDDIVPNINWTIAPNLNYSLAPNASLGLSGKGTIIANDFNADIDARIFQGTVATKLKVILPALKNFDIQKISTLKINVDIADLVIQKSDLESLIASKPKTSEPPQNKSTPDEKRAVSKPKDETPLIAPFDLKLSLNNIQVIDNLIAGQGKVSLERSGILKNNLDLNVGKGKLSQKFSGKIYPEFNGGLDLDIRNIQGNIINPFLPANMGEVQGVVNGSINSKFKQVNEITQYDAKFSISATEGKISKIDPSVWLNDIISSLGPIAPKVKDYATKVKIEPDFSLLTISGSANQNLINIKKLFFKGVKDKFEINGSGYIAQQVDKNSELLVTYKDYDGNLSDFLKKEIKDEILPLRLAGLGMNLKPDTNYTLKKLSKSFMKNKGKDKIKEELKKVQDKLLKGDEGKKINKLLKGIFQ